MISKCEDNSFNISKVELLRIFSKPNRNDIIEKDFFKEDVKVIIRISKIKYFDEQDNILVYSYFNSKEKNEMFLKNISNYLDSLYHIKI